MAKGGQFSRNLQYGADNPIMFNDPLGDQFGGINGERGDQMQAHPTNDMWSWNSYGGGAFAGGSKEGNYSQFWDLILGNDYLNTEGVKLINRNGVFGFWSKRYDYSISNESGKDMNSGIKVLTDKWNSITRAPDEMHAYTPESNWASKWENFNNSVVGSVLGGVGAKALYGVANSMWSMGSTLKNGWRQARNMKDEHLISTYGAKKTETMQLINFLSAMSVPLGGIGGGAAATEETVYRVFGEDSKAEGFSWTPENPCNVNDFRNVAGLPSGGESGFTNSAQFMIEGKVNVQNIIQQRAALPLDGNIGGMREYIINPDHVTITNFSVLHP